MTGAYTESKSFVDSMQRRNQVLLASLDWRPVARFEANVWLELQDHRFADTGDIGIPIIGKRIAPVPRERCYVDPVKRELPNRQQRRLLALDWTWTIDAHWKLTQRAHWDRRDEQPPTLWLNGFDGVSVMERGLWFVHPQRSTFATDLDLAGDLELGGLRHGVLIGADAFRFEGNWHGFSGTTPEVPAIDIFAPTYGIRTDALRALPENFFYADRDRWNGVYAQDQVTLSERWQLLVGGRWDVAKTGFGSADSLAASKDAVVLERDRAFPPRMGVPYQLAPATALYASFAKSFGTNNGRTAGGAVIDPQQARQWELGLKHQSADGRLTAPAALFRLTKTNLKTPDLSTPDPDDVAPIGEVRKQRHRLPNVPRHAGSLWATWDLLPGAAQGFELGAGMWVCSQRQGDNANRWQLPGHARTAAMLRWRTPVAGQRITAQLNVENLFDRTCVDRGGSGGAGAKYGSPRARPALPGAARVRGARPRQRCRTRARPLGRHRRHLAPGDGLRLRAALLARAGHDGRVDPRHPRVGLHLTLPARPGGPGFSRRWAPAWRVKRGAGNSVSNWLYALHMGNLFGLPYRIFVCLLGLTITLLCATGVVPWWIKRRARVAAAGRIAGTRPALSLPTPVKE